MNYLLKTTNASRRGRLNLLGVALVVALVFIFAFASPLRTFLAPAAVKTLAPVFTAANFLKAKTIFLFNFARPKAALVKENEFLKKELENRRAKLFDYERLERENEELLNLSSQHSARNMVTVRVLRVPDSSPYDTILIDAGAGSGITVGSYVFAAAEVPIGEVEYVYPSLSRVKLFSSPGETHTVRIGAEKITAKATGQGGGNFEALLPRGVSVSVGDTVVLSDVSEKAFAAVLHIAETEGGTFVRLLFKNPVSLSGLQFVAVGVKKQI